MNSIVLEDICMEFQGTKVLKGINIEIQQGEIFGLLGPSGAGKTTLIKILTGQLIPSEGRAVILEDDSRRIQSETYLKFGMVLDNTGLYERLSCYDNIKLFADIYGVDKHKISEVLDQVGLLEVKNRPVIKLSKGMKQRLVLARSVMHKPEILFLDEPTSGLDPATAMEIHNLIIKQKERGATVFLTTHNMEEATKLCDHVALLHEGKVVEYGPPKDVCRRYNHQNKIEIRLVDGEKIQMNNDASVSDQIADLFRENKIETIHSTEPNLETVFIELTGRSFL